MLAERAFVQRHHHSRIVTKLQQQQRLLDAKQRRIERELAQPSVKVQSPDVPFIPPVDSRQGGYVGQRILLRDERGRYIEL